MTKIILPLVLALVLLGCLATQAQANGFFAADCSLTERKPLDPVVFPRQPGRSHLHDFFGPRVVRDQDLPKDLAQTDHSCSIEQDRSAYWMPSMYANYRLVQGQHLQAYYRFRGGEVPMPKGLVMLAGDPARTRTNPQWSSWSCWPGGTYGYTLPPACTKKQQWLLAEIDFPSCWNGKDLDSPNHRSHVAYPDQYERCPRAHPVRLPQLVMFRNFVADQSWNGFSQNIFLASGSAGSLHADFVSGWERKDFLALMKQCREKQCGHLGNLKQPSPVSAQPAKQSKGLFCRLKGRRHPVDRRANNQPQALLH